MWLNRLKSLKCAIKCSFSESSDAIKIDSGQFAPDKSTTIGFVFRARFYWAEVL